ncbi:MAG: purine-nucleoside phosphorylase [Eubacterium sp.]|nr:purine-nucleoside phosphorylase [Eubacterium sp.]
MSENVNKSINECDPFAAADFIRSKISFDPFFGIVLGSGLGGLADEIKVTDRISYSDIPGFPKSTVEGHKGEYIFGYLDEVPVILMNGRVHFYEGYPMQQVVTPVRVMALLGAKNIFLTNASGGLNRSYKPGTLMCINDHITSFIPSPLLGPNDDRLSTRFPAMSQVYDREYMAVMHKVADGLGIPLEDGVYLQVTGPAFESPAESRAYAMLGADAVGMSTACEAVVLCAMGVRLLGLSCVTDMAIDNEDIEVTHEEVQAVANQAGTKLIQIVRNTVSSIYRGL